ncbi:hypothetical protein EYF80_019916 [Liparis tanakae]|uniref:Uncharacterized protein n=1 Tax=Liparis tanakae TaxID=230148 RepID=A0A4Z2HVZ3_9TELE|nr:hypothetical protein EYF80_019916 [Liparis tanakae]
MTLDCKINEFSDPLSRETTRGPWDEVGLKGGFRPDSTEQNPPHHCASSGDKEYETGREKKLFNTAGSCREPNKETDERALSWSDCEGVRFIQEHLQGLQMSSAGEREQRHNPAH